MTAKLKKTICGIIIAAAAAAAGMAGLILVRNHCQKEYVTRMNQAVKAVYIGINCYLTEEYEGRSPKGAPDNIYYGTFIAQHADRAGEFRFEPEDGSAFTSTHFTADSVGISNSYLHDNLYFVLEIKDNAVIRISACERDILTKEDLEPVRHGPEGYQISLAEFYLKRLIVYYPG